MNEQIDVLDHGYVKLIETWGSDERIIEAARMSTHKGFLGWGPTTCLGCDLTGLGPQKSCRKCNGTGEVPGDEKLLAFLYKNQHMTPFEMAGMIIEVQAPLFVFREWHRHRTQSYNELSARYTPMPDVNYIPTETRLLVSGGSNKQTQGTGKALRPDRATEVTYELSDFYKAAQELYDTFLADGVPKELARLVIPVGRYSRMRASANLRNWLAFLTLRSDKNPDAQWEIRQYANVVGQLVKEQFPRTYGLFNV